MRKKIVKVSVLIVIFFTAGCSSSFEIIDKPVEFSDERIELTKKYIRTHYGIEADNINITPKIIVLHWTAVDDFNKCFEIFNKQTLGESRPKLAGAGRVNVAIQFLVDKNGAVYRLMPETNMARHCIGINYNSIGVESVGGGKGIDNLTDAQVEANAELIRYLVNKYSTIDYLIGHHEYMEFENHPLWLELDDNYRTEKSDPGDRFMYEVRKKVSDLKLKGVEEIKK